MREKTDRVTAARDVRRAGWVGLICNLVLAAVKGGAGLIGNSQAVLADAVHSLTDLATDLAVILGVRYWSAPADEEHPHGHGRIETLVTVVIGLSLATVAVGMGLRAIRGLQQGVGAAPTSIAFAGAVLSIIVKEILYRWTAVVGRRARSSATAANAWHHRSDALSSIPAAAAVGVTLIDPEWAVVDRVGAIVVCILILQASWRILRPAIAELMDRGAPAADRRRIEALALQIDGVESAHAVRSRYVGAELAVDLHVEVDGGLTVTDGHAIARAVRRKLLEDGPDVIDAVVQVEPCRCQLENPLADDSDTR